MKHVKVSTKLIFLDDYPLKKPITYMISLNNGMLTKSYAIEGIYIEINAYIGGDKNLGCPLKF